MIKKKLMEHIILLNCPIYIKIVTALYLFFAQLQAVDVIRWHLAVWGSSHANPPRIHITFFSNYLHDYVANYPWGLWDSRMFRKFNSIQWKISNSFGLEYTYKESGVRFISIRCMLIYWARLHSGPNVLIRVIIITTAAATIYYNIIPGKSKSPS